MPRRKEPRIPHAVLDQLLAGADPKTVFHPNGLIGMAGEIIPELRATSVGISTLRGHLGEFGINIDSGAALP